MTKYIQKLTTIFGIRSTALRLFSAILMLTILSVTSQSVYGQSADEAYEECVEFAYANHWGLALEIALDVCENVAEIAEEIAEETERVQQELDNISVVPGPHSDEPSQGNPSPCSQFYCSPPYSCNLDADLPHCKEEDT